MRIFIAINFPEEARGEIIKIQESLPDFVGKKTEFENLHLTLKFLGDVEDSKLDEIKKRLKVINEKAFISEITSIGTFSKEFSKIVWLHISNCETLQEKIDESLFGLFEKEKRFMSHVTIARIKKISDKEFFLKKIEVLKIKNLSFPVEKFSLMKSELTSSGPVYSVVEEYPLH